MAAMLLNWKTTVAGLAAILTAAGVLLNQIASGSVTPDSLGNFVIAVVAGAGLLFAKDHNVSGTK